MEQQLTRIAVKIGSNVLTRRDGTLDVTRMSALVDQIAELHKAGIEIILVSSGAVASASNKVENKITNSHHKPFPILPGQHKTNIYLPPY